MDDTGSVWHSANGTGLASLGGLSGVGIGSGANGYDGVAVGMGAMGGGGVAVGINTFTGGGTAGGIAIGRNIDNDSNSGNISIGKDIEASGDYNIVIGRNVDMNSSNGCAAIGIDNTGASPNFSLSGGQANVMLLGTALHTVKIAGSLTVAGVPVATGTDIEAQANEIRSLRDELSALRAIVNRCCGAAD
jgi:hypothetical protein